jgi:hypothetical protein
MHTIIYNNITGKISNDDDNKEAIKAFEIIIDFGW